MSLGFINNTIEEIEKNIENKDGNVINTNIVIKKNEESKAELKRMEIVFKRLIEMKKDVTSINNDLTLSQTQHKIFKLFIAYIQLSLNINGNTNMPPHFDEIFNLFNFNLPNDKQNLKTKIKECISNNIFIHIFNTYMNLKIDEHNTRDFSDKIYEYFKHTVLERVQNGSFNADGTLVSSSQYGKTGLPMYAQNFQLYQQNMQRNIIQPRVEDDVCFKSGINSNALPTDFFQNLLVEKTKVNEPDKYYYKNKKISDDCMIKIKMNNENDKLFEMGLKELENKPTHLPGITKENKEEIVKRINNIFEIEEFNENLKTISSSLNEFLKDITSIDKKTSYEFHLLQIESFFATLEKFEKTIDITPFESPKKINLDDLKASIPTEPISEEKLEKIKIKSASVNKLIEELNKKDSFKKIDELLYGEKHEEYLTDLHKMNYNNGNVLYNSMGMPNTYSSGTYTTSLPSSLRNLGKNYNNPIEMEVLKPLIEAFSSSENIIKHSAFKNHSKWLRDHSSIREQIIQHFANEESFQKLKNFSIAMYNLGQDPDTSDLFKETGYYDRDSSDILNVNPLTTVSAFVLEVKRYEEKPDIIKHPELEKYFHKVLNFNSSKAIWTREGTEDETFNTTLK
jgi:hypothetical protein